MLEMARAATLHGLRMPPELALLGKTLLNLDEIGRLLDPDFDVNASMRRNATQRDAAADAEERDAGATCFQRRWRCATSPSGCPDA